jgi:hypothetical protein
MDHYNPAIDTQDVMDTAYILHDLPNRRLVTEPIRDQDFPCHARCPLAVRTGQIWAFEG